MQSGKTQSLHLQGEAEEFPMIAEPFSANYKCISFKLTKADASKSDAETFIIPFPTEKQPLKKLQKVIFDYDEGKMFYDF